MTSTTSHGVPHGPLSKSLFPFQADVVEWALERERCAIFADTGLGKALMQLEWAHCVRAATKGRVLILAPLAVAAQTEREAQKFRMGGVVSVRHPDDSDAPILVTNYDRLHLFQDREWAGIVLDESSILKSIDSHTRDELTRWARKIRYRLCCTATPAPNDHTELGNHADFLGVMTRAQMIGEFFVHDEEEMGVQNYRLKGHAKEAFWRWVAGWAIAVRRPSDLGHPDDGYILPPLKLVHEWLGDARVSEDRLFAVDARTLDERREARLSSTDDRVAACAAAVALEPDEPWIIWCDYNREAEALKRSIPGSVEVRGPDSPESKEKALLDFASGETRVLITKPSICGFGLNWQHCARVAFVGHRVRGLRVTQARPRLHRRGVEALILGSGAAESGGREGAAFSPRGASVTEPAPVQLDMLTTSDEAKVYICPTCRGNRQAIRVLYPDEAIERGRLTEVAPCRTCNATGTLTYDPDDRSEIPF